MPVFGGTTVDCEPICEGCAEVRGLDPDDPEHLYPLAEPAQCERCGVHLEPTDVAKPPLVSLSNERTKEYFTFLVARARTRRGGLNLGEHSK